MLQNTNVGKLMARSAYDDVIGLLDSHQVQYQLNVHEPVVTHEEAVAVTGDDPLRGAKSLVMKTDSGFMLVVVRGPNRMDYNKVRKYLGIRKIRFATPEEVIEVMRVKIGACYPFGEVAGVPMLVDKTLAENEVITFSPGRHDTHISMPFDEYKRVTKPKLIDIVKQ